MTVYNKVKIIGADGTLSLGVYRADKGRCNIAGSCRIGGCNGSSYLITLGGEDYDICGIDVKDLGAFYEPTYMVPSDEAKYGVVCQITNKARK